MKDNGGSDPGECAVDQGWGGRSNIFVGIGVDAGEASQHVDMGDLDFVEEQESIVHGAKGCQPTRTSSRRKAEYTHL